ncbi:FecR family protein [Adhaeretor mobilis]|uniref:FecR protein n=1 Tax=Adhaeretor mobilis TaxID=1930276 RepID=A0A517N1L3_9BACT|nr:FecR family protein [Adhaeretor mobilis]QDT00898.1 FecR protein [Adhaeretor mobilis]
MDAIRLHTLVSGWIDKSIAPEEMRELATALKEDANTRRLYLKYMSVHAELCSLEAAQDYFDSIDANQTECSGKTHSNQGNNVKPEPASRKSSSTVRNWGLFAIASGLLLAIGIWQSADRWDLNRSRPTAEFQILDALKPISEDCTWYVEQTPRLRANLCMPGDVIRVTKGKLELKYAHGSKVVLHAPAAYELISNMKARILLGRLTATVSDQAKGFSVLTPRAMVVDLGTQFGVEVNNDGATDVVVFEGEVDVDYNDHTDRNSAQRLRMGEAVHLDAIGTASRIVSINRRTYSSKSLESFSRPAVISEVHDNIERSSSMLNYYEIVPQGMQEDAFAFVDRVAHQWNGVTPAGMPPYLLGGDYVKTFNSDKFNPDIQVSVKVDVPCRLYVLFDNRLPAPAWLKRDFQDTGDEIGLDTGPYQTYNHAWHNQGPSGVGPGESVEDTLSVWVKVVAEPTVVFLGSTEAPESEPNMYGIVAVSLDAQ